MSNKSILKKQIMLYAGILLTTFFLLGAVLSVFYTRIYMKETEEKLIEQGQTISKEIAKTHITGDMKDLQYELQVLDDYMKATVFFINRDGIMVMASPGIKEKWIGQAIANIDAMEAILAGKVVTLEGRINGMFDEPVLMVGYPFRSGQIAGIFMCTSMPEIQRSLQGVYIVGLFSFLVALVLGTILVYFSTKKITHPLLEMNKAAKIIAGGDFAQRVEISSEDEVGQLAESFNHMAKSLHEYEKKRREFIANVSHDLRSPLTSMQGFLNAILDGTIPVEKQNHYLHVVLEETQRLTKLSNDIVDLSQAQTSAVVVNREKFALNELIRELLELFEPSILQKKLDVKVLFYEKETFVWADKEKIQRVIQNLLDNAIKFSDEMGSIEMETNKMEKNRISVSVKDFGKGISKEDQKYVFDRFYKVDASRGIDKTGSGLGLSIVKEFILAHGESIAVTSEVTKGTTFIFSLQLSDEA